MDFILWIVLIVLAAVAVCHIILFFVWLKGNIDLSNFFTSKGSVWVFFVPIVGLFGFLAGAVAARVREDFPQ